MGIYAGLVVAAFLLAAHPTSASAGVVRAEDHSSFWIWGGIKPQPVLSQARTLYILQGQVTEKEVETGRKAVVIPQGTAVGRITDRDVWLVYRATTLEWTPETVRAILSRLERWKLSGNRAVGIQIDFDVKTRRLPEYVRFLQKLRSRVPTEYRLSITGLLDWANNGDPEAINGLKHVVDEVVVQTYQGRRTVRNYQAYLPALKRLALPFKIGIIQNGEWQAPSDLESNPFFQGYVVFLQNERSATASPDVDMKGRSVAFEGEK
jgi:hypothetical protein